MISGYLDINANPSTSLRTGLGAEGGEGSCRVTGLPSKGMTMEAVHTRPGALALIRVSDLTPEMKVLSIDGRKPDSPGYALQ